MLAQKPFAVLSGLHISAIADHEQYVMYTFFEPDGSMRVALLSDYDTQMKPVYPPVNVPGLSPERVFWMRQNDKKPWEVEVERGAFMSFTIEDCA